MGVGVLRCVYDILVLIIGELLAPLWKRGSVYGESWPILVQEGYGLALIIKWASGPNYRRVWLVFYFL